MPITAPTTNAQPTGVMPMKSDSRAPTIKRDSMSRPSSSVPNQCAADGDFSAELCESPDVRTGDARVEHVAAEANAAPGQRPQVVAQREQLLLGGIARRVLALWRVRKLCTRTKHVAVGIHRP